MSLKKPHLLFIPKGGIVVFEFFKYLGNNSLAHKFRPVVYLKTLAIVINCFEFALVK